MSQLERNWLDRHRQLTAVVPARLFREGGGNKFGQRVVKREIIVYVH